MDPETLAFPPQETRRKPSVTMRFRMQQEAQQAISLQLRGPSSCGEDSVLVGQREQQEGEMAGGGALDCPSGKGWRSWWRLGWVHPQLLNEEGHKGNAKTQPHGLDPSPVPSLRAGGRKRILCNLESVLMSESAGPPLLTHLRQARSSLGAPNRQVQPA